MKNIFCYGDSNTWGHNPGDFNPKTGLYGRYPENVRWPRVMESLLGEGYRVYEEGLCGRTTTFEDPTHYGWNGITHYEVAFRTCEPIDCIIIMLGTNDQKDLFNADTFNLTMALDRFFKQVYFLREFSFNPDAKVLVVNPCGIAKAADGKYCLGNSEQSAEKAIAMKEVYKNEADTLGFDFFDASAVTGPGDADGVHLSEEGHKKLAKAMAEKVKELIG